MESKYPAFSVGQVINSLPEDITIQIEDDFINSHIDSSIINKLVFSSICSKRSIVRYMKNKRYPIWFLKIVNLFYGAIIIGLENKEVKYFSKWKFVSLPSKVDSKLAYFVGYLQGDGAIESNSKRIDFSDEYISQITKINEMSEDLFNVRGNVIECVSKISKKPSYKLDIGSKALNCYLSSLFNIKKGVKDSLTIPKIILENKEILRYYISGLFDADGTLPKNPKKCKQFFIDITLKDRKFIEEIRNSLKIFGISTYEPYCRTAKSPTSDYISKTWELRIRRKRDIIMFLKQIPFAHPDKKRRSKELLGLVV